jgi:hypothetical protein
VKARTSTGTDLSAPALLWTDRLEQQIEIEFETEQKNQHNGTGAQRHMQASSQATSTAVTYSSRASRVILTNLPHKGKGCALYNTTCASLCTLYMCQQLLSRGAYPRATAAHHKIPDAALNVLITLGIFAWW